MNSTRNITCSPSSFEGTDPLPGQDKQCFCDDHRTHATEETISWVKSYWRNIKLEKQARAAEVKIEAEVNALELVALEDSVTAKQALEKEQQSEEARNKKTEKEEADLLLEEEK